VTAPGRPAATASSLRHVAWIALLLATVTAAEDPAAQLQESFAALAAERANNPFPDQLYLRSEEASDRLQGEVHARVDHPFDTLRTTLGAASDWCDVLILHLNVKYCRASGDGDRQTLDVALGRKFDEPLSDVFWARFTFRVTASSPGYLALTLAAPEGPLNTSDYRIAFEAAPADAMHTIVALRYSYRYGFLARNAMRMYLATLGSDKVGFTALDPAQAGGLVAGVRGVVERNTMRYFLAVDAYLATRDLPPAARMDAMLRHWFAATERYPRQLHECEEVDYLAMKGREIQRQTHTPPPH
jgi:hypothetical protein